MNSNKFLARFRKKNDVNVTVTKKYYLVPECSERVSHPLGSKNHAVTVLWRGSVFASFT